MQHIIKASRIVNNLDFDAVDLAELCFPVCRLDPGLFLCGNLNRTKVFVKFLISGVAFAQTLAGVAAFAQNILCNVCGNIHHIVKVQLVGFCILHIIKQLRQLLLQHFSLDSALVLAFKARNQPVHALISDLVPGAALEFSLQDANGGFQPLVLLCQLLILSCKLSIFLADGVRLGNRIPNVAVLISDFHL